MDYFNENIRYLLCKKDEDRSRAVDPATRLASWSKRLETWIGDAGRSRILLFGGPPSDREIARLTEISGRDVETLRNGRLADECSILTENISFLFATVEHGQMSAVAERLGVNQSTIQRWRSGSKPAANKQSKIAEEFGLPPSIDLNDNTLFLSLDPISLRQKREWLKARVEELDQHELTELFPALRRILGEKP